MFRRQARRHGGISGPPLQITTCAPQARSVPPIEDCTSKESNMPGATGMHFGACAPPKNAARAPQSE